MTVSGATDATTLKNCIDFRKLTVFSISSNLTKIT